MKAKASVRNREGRPSQIDLIAAVTKELTRQGYPQANERHWKAIIGAVDLIVNEMGKPHLVSAPNSGLAGWLASDDTGMSSRALAWACAASAVAWPSRRPCGEDLEAHPHDPDDFGRCVRLLEAVPEFRGRLALAAGISPVWARLVAAWDELEALYRRESPSGSAPKLYARMKELTG